jgi:hypothetical protein
MIYQSPGLSLIIITIDIKMVLDLQLNRAWNEVLALSTNSSSVDQRTVPGRDRLSDELPMKPVALDRCVAYRYVAAVDSASVDDCWCRRCCCCRLVTTSTTTTTIRLTDGGSRRQQALVLELRQTNNRECYSTPCFPRPCTVQYTFHSSRLFAGQYCIK